MAMMRAALKAVPWRVAATVEAPGWARAMSAAGVNKMALIKDLRERSGAPITDVKAVLEATGWDLEEAQKELRKKGLAAASKKASRHAAEGLVAVAQRGSAVAVAELNSETDFVARMREFQALAGSVAAAALESAETGVATGPGGLALDKDAVLGLAVGGEGATAGATVSAAAAELAGTVRENVAFRRASVLAAGPGGVVATYVHGAVVPGGPGRIAAAVAVAGAGGEDLSGDAEVAEVARQLAMHVAAASPSALSRAQVDPSALEAERKLLAAQAAGSGKKPEIVAKMVEGRLSKFYSETCLLEQRFVVDESKKVETVVKELGKAKGLSLSLHGFLRVQVGEGIEAEAKDFAAEVAETLKATSSA